MNNSTSKDSLQVPPKPQRASLAVTPCSASSFTFALKNYPNGQTYFVIERGKLVLGSCVKSGEGYLVSGKRKTVPTLIHAAKQMIDDRMNACRAEEAKWRKTMNALSRECGPLLPNVPGQERALPNGEK